MPLFSFSLCLTVTLNECLIEYCCMFYFSLVVIINKVPNLCEHPRGMLFLKILPCK